MTARTWAAIPGGGTLAAINPSNSATYNPSYSGPGSASPWDDTGTKHPRIVTAWNGSHLDTDTDTQYLCAAGGHDDYGGNEIYRRSLRSETPTWELLRAPTASLTVGSGVTLNDGQELSGVYSDGRPRSTHTYNGCVYVPGRGPVLAGMGSNHYSGAGASRFVFFGTGADTAVVSAALTAYISNGSAAGSGACYDPNRDAIWWLANDTSMVRYTLPASGSIDSGTYATVGSGTGLTNSVSLCYLPDADCILIGRGAFNHTGGTWRVFDCATGTLYAPTFTGSVSGFLDPGSAQPRWVPSLGCACAWNNTSNTTAIMTLTPSANPRTDGWTISSLSVDGSNSVTPTATTANGTFGRFVYSPNLGGFFVFSSTSETGHFFKL